MKTLDEYLKLPIHGNRRRPGRRGIHYIFSGSARLYYLWGNHREKQWITERKQKGCGWKLLWKREYQFRNLTIWRNIRDSSN